MCIDFDYLLGHLDDNWDEEFTYDILGNRDSHKVDGVVTDTYTSNTVNEYTQIVVNSVTKTPAHDNAGNLTTDINGYTYEYDYENRITSIKKNSGADVVAEYTYDALGRRIQVKDAQEATAAKFTRFYYDGNRVLLESDADEDVNGNPDDSTESDARYYVFGNYIDEVLVMTDVDSGNSVTDGDYYYGHDHLYSPTVLFADTGTIVERYEYNAYGKCTVLNPDFTADTDNISNYENPYLFTGRRLDILDTGSLKIQYSRARYYDAETGRFLQRDPLGYVDGMDLYEYTLSSPTNYVDILGFMASRQPKKYDPVIEPPRKPIEEEVMEDWKESNKGKGKGKTHVVCTFVYNTSNDPKNRNAGKIACTDGKKTVTCDTFSGNGSCTNNPDKQKVKDKGPLPVGDYIIGNEYLYKGKANQYWYKLYYKGRDGGYHYGPGYGDGHNRDRFNLHSGSYSEGCCTVDYDSKKNGPKKPYPRQDCFDKIRDMLNDSKYIRKGDENSGRLIVQPVLPIKGNAYN